MTSQEIRNALVKKIAEEKAALDKSYLVENMYRIDMVERAIGSARNQLGYIGSLLSNDDLEDLKQRILSSIDALKNDSPHNHAIVRKGTAMTYDEHDEQWEIISGYGYFSKERGEKYLKEEVENEPS